MLKKFHLILFYHLWLPLISFQLFFAPVALEKAYAQGSDPITVNTDGIQDTVKEGQERANQRSEEGAELGQRGRDLLREGFEEGDKTLDYAYGEGARLANQTYTEAAMLLSVVIIFLAFKLILGSLWKILKGAVVGIAKLAGKGKNWKVMGKAKCLLYPTDILIVMASLVHLGLEGLAANNLYESIKGLIKNILDELNGKKTGSSDQKTFEEVLNDPILDILLVSDPKWFKDFGNDMVGTSAEQSRVLAPILARKRNIQSAIDCIKSECANANDPTRPERAIKCRGAMALIPQLEAQLAVLDAQLQNIHQEFKGTFDKYASEIPDLSGKLKKVRQMVGQYEQKGLSFVRVFSYTISILSAFLNFEEQRHFAYQMSVVAWILALTSAIAKKFIPQVVECFGWTDVIKILYIMLVVFIYVGYSPAFFMPANSVKAKSLDKAHDKEGWVEVPTKGALEKIPGVKSLIASVMDEYDKKYKEIKDLITEMRKKMNQNVNFEEKKDDAKATYAKRQEVATLIFGLIPFHDHRMGLLKGRIEAMKGLEKKITALYSDGVTLGDNVMNDLKEFREKVRGELEKAFKGISDSYNKTLNEVDVQIENTNKVIEQLGFACKIAPGPPAPQLEGPAPATTPTPASASTWKEFHKFQESVLEKLEQIEKEQSLLRNQWSNVLKFWSLLGVRPAFAQKGHSTSIEGESGSCVRRDLLPDPQCSCRNNKTCFQVDLAYMAAEMKDKNALSYLTLANKVVRGDSLSLGEEKFIGQYYQQMMQPQTLGKKYSQALGKLGIVEAKGGLDKEGFKKLSAQLLEKVMSHGTQEYGRDPSIRHYFKVAAYLEDKNLERMLKMVGRPMPVTKRLDSSSGKGKDENAHSGEAFEATFDPSWNEGGEVGEGNKSDDVVRAKVNYKIKSIYTKGDKSIWEIIRQRYLKHFYK